MKKIFTLLILLTLFSSSYSQSLKGYVFSETGEPITYATVIVQKIDSTFLKAAVTNTEGLFVFDYQYGGDVRLLIQHLNYKPYVTTVSAGFNSVDTIRLTAVENVIQGFVVTAKRPQIVIRDGALSYNPQILMKGKAASNAFDLLKETPGVMGNQDEIELIGAGKVGIIINSKPSTMPKEQIIALLKSIPASRVVDIEVMYNAPPRYNVNGALVNVILEKQSDGGKEILGEVGLEYSQQFYSSGAVRGNIIYQTPKFTFDVLANVGLGKSRSEDNLYSIYSGGKETLEVDQFSRTISNKEKYDVRVGADYKFKNGDNISASYYYDSYNSNSKTYSDNFVTFATQKIINSVNSGDGRDQLHNAMVQYTGHKKINIGAEFTSYNSPSNLHLIENNGDIETNNYQNKSTQQISKWSIFADHTIVMKKGWSLNYGFNIGMSKADNRVNYLYPNADDIFMENYQKRTKSVLDEMSGVVFAGVTAKINPKLSLSATLKAEYFKTDYQEKGTRTTLWNEWALYPSATLTYKAAPKGTLQFNLTSSKNYPSYWTLSPQSTQMNAYMVIEGNPELKPSRSYRSQLMYILDRKYIFMLFGTYSPGAFQQLPFQRDEMTIYRFENLDYTLNFGAGVVVPFKVGFWSSRATVQGIMIQDKATYFHGESFNNRSAALVVMLNNTFTLSKSKPNINLQLDGRYQSSGIQGIYNLGAAYTLSSALKWTLENGSYFMVRYNNILEHQTPRPIIVDWRGQYSRRVNGEFNSVVLSFSWRFGKYKENNYNTVDDSRFGK